jgi:hypothetical protein
MKAIIILFALGIALTIFFIAFTPSSFDNPEQELRRLVENTQDDPLLTERFFQALNKQNIAVIKLEPHNRLWIDPDSTTRIQEPPHVQMVREGQLLFSNTTSKYTFEFRLKGKDGTIFWNIQALDYDNMEDDRYLLTEHDGGYVIKKGNPAKGWEVVYE